ncbi:hypothetical protein SDC9_189988 [bioreactor metagenome]|uniref:Uncharacterized protein n=1 Tax=bioreactor metagenome TaxID=1076179 RepID=A0A645HTR1_9ZZZZ
MIVWGRVLLSAVIVMGTGNLIARHAMAEGLSGVKIAPAEALIQRKSLCREDRTIILKILTEIGLLVTKSALTGML